MASKSFSMSAVFFAVMGQRIDGYTDGGGITVTAPGDIAEEVVGTDGLVTRVDTNDRRLHLQVSVQRTSRAFTILHLLVQQQLKDAEFRMDVQLIDLNSDSQFAVSSSDAYFTEYPEWEKSDGPGEVEFTISLPNGLESVTAAP